MPTAGPLTNVNLGQLFKDFGHNLYEEAAKALGAVNKSLGVLGEFSQMAEQIHDAIDRAHDDLEEFKHYTPPNLSDWKTRVVSIPKAWQSIRELFDDLVDLFKNQFAELRDQFLALKNEIESSHAPPVGSEEAGGAIANFESKLVSIQITAQKVTNLLVKLVDVADTLADIKKKIESGEDLFLSQANPKHRKKDPGYHLTRKP